MSYEISTTLGQAGVIRNLFDKNVPNLTAYSYMTEAPYDATQASTLLLNRYTYPRHTKPALVSARHVAGISLSAQIILEQPVQFLGVGDAGLDSFEASSLIDEILLHVEPQVARISFLSRANECDVLGLEAADASQAVTGLCLAVQRRLLSR